MVALTKIRAMLKSGEYRRLCQSKIVSRDRVGRRLRRHWPVFFLTFCLFQPAAVVWGDYLLTLKSGLQIRARYFQTDEATIRVWTESGSLTLSKEIVHQITEIASQAHTTPQIFPEKNSDLLSEEQARETPSVQNPVSPLYIPDEQESP